MFAEDKKREWFLAIAMGVILSSPLLVMLIPRAVANTLHHSPSHLVIFVTSGSYLFYLVGFLLVFGSMLIVYLMWGERLSIILCIGLLFMSGGVFFVASKHYVAIGDDAISYNLLFSTTEKTYQWADVEQAIYKPKSASDGRWQYEFTFTDGEKLNVVENGYLEEIREWIAHRLKQEDIQLGIK